MADGPNPLTTAINLLRRLPPKDIEQDVVRVSCLIDPDLEDELYQRVDLPLKVKSDPVSGRDFIVCDYNRDGDSHRSPWSNTYHPELPDGISPKGELRDLEMAANGIFDVYRRQYFDSGSVSSVYMWEMDGPNNFAGAFLIHKAVNSEQFTGEWNSVHVVEATQKGDSYVYRTTSTLLLMIQSSEGSKLGAVNLSGSNTVTAEVEKPFKSNDAKQCHIGAIGPLIEKAEKELSRSVEGIYFSKTNEVQCGMRTVDAGVKKNQQAMANAFMQAQKKRMAQKQ